MSEVFRTREIESEKIEVPEKPAEVTGIVEKKEEFFVESDNLENWETNNGKYGLAYLGIEEIGKTFPLNTQFGIVDKYIKAELEERGYDKTTARWQEVLKELETEFGTDKLNAVERLKKLAQMVNIIKKQKEFNKKRELYKAFRTEFNDSQD
jgi:hypothetical protein